MIRRLFSSMMELQQQLSSLSAAPITDASFSFGTRKNWDFKIGADLESLGWLQDYTPHFPVNGDAITVIEEPGQFYETVLERCSTAKRRIMLASLYLGVGELEQDLVRKMLENMKNNPGLTVDILLDFQRGTRGLVNSKTILQPLLEQSANFSLSLYHTPNLRGLKKRFMPARWNELIGLQHMKVYLFDDEVIISGANLSQDYFTNRQDRYIMIEDKGLSDFYSDLVRTVQEFSLKVDNSNRDNFSCHPQWSSGQLPYEGDQSTFVREARSRILRLCERTREHQESLQIGASMDTFVFPLIEMGQLAIHHDSVVTRRIFERSLPESSIKLASGYFNLTEELVETIIDECPADCSILMAHPNANGFKGARGAAGGIPDAYTLLACQFQDHFKARNQASRIHLYEFEKLNWTYHAKGLWYYLPGHTLPAMTLIGSSNFGERSVNRDLESQICIVTSNAALKSRLHQECEHLFRIGSTAEQAITERAIPRWVRAVVHQFRNFF